MMLLLRNDFTSLICDFARCAVIGIPQSQHNATTMQENTDNQSNTEGQQFEGPLVRPLCTLLVLCAVVCSTGVPASSVASTAESEAVSSAIERRSEIAFQIPEPDLIPEGLAYDPTDRAFYVGGTHRRKIVRIDSTGASSDFVSEGKADLYQVLGIKIDSTRRTLWACSAAESENKQFEGYSGIFQFSLTTGKLIAKHVLERTSGPHLFNDLIISSAGDIFFTDSKVGCVYTIQHSKNIIEPFTPRDTFVYPNGIAFSPDQKIIFVADQKGITRIDRETGTRTSLTHPPGDVIRAIDGLYFYRDSLLGIQAGPSGQRVVRLVLNAHLDRVMRVRVLDANNSLFDIPTTGAVVGDEFFFIGNSQMQKVADDGTISAPEKLQSVRILRLKL